MNDDGAAPVKGDCPYCGPDRWAVVIAEKQRRLDDEALEVWTDDTYRLLECRGCDTVYFQQISYFSETREYVGDEGEYRLLPTTIYFPSLSKRKRPDWIWSLGVSGAHEVSELFKSLYVAIDNDLIVLAASGVRTVFDLVVTRLGIDPAISFEEKIDALKEQGRIGTLEQHDIDVMVNAGHSAMHRGWKPSSEELDTMMTTLERFIHHVFVLNGKSAKLREALPHRPKRRKDGK